MREAYPLAKSGGVIRRLVTLALIVTLGACERKAEPVSFAVSRLAPGAAASAWPPAGWGWGLLKLGDRPTLRYGVSGPSGVPVGDVVILPSYGESAEWWFETASDLNREGYTVWIMDGAGQGGSGRFNATQDLGHVPDFESDIQGIAALIRIIIRPAPGKPVKVIASGTAALTALAAAERGVAIERLIFSAPVELPATTGAARLGIKTARAEGSIPWTRPDPAIPVTRRQKTALGWAVANPDLRMGGPSVGWLLAREKLLGTVTRPEALAKIKAPVTIITATGEVATPCDRLPRCLMRPLPARLPYHLEEDHVRAAWLSALVGELGTDHAS